MLNTKTRFTFHNVGQGLFYTGEIDFNNQNENKFLFVYDCGSEKKRFITKAINDFSKDALKKEIDMLVISHFHEDHISGLDNLLNEFDIRTVIIPYFSPLSRLIIVSLNLEQESWYYEFLANPVVYLINRGVKRVILIVGNNPDENNPNDEDLPKPPDNLEDKGIKDLFKVNLERYEQENMIKSIEKIENLGNKAEIYSHKGYIMLNGLWLFKFFNYKFNNTQILESCLIKKIQGFSINKVDKIIRNINKYKKGIKYCYNQITKSHNLKNFNNTSLVMMHTPINYSQIKCKGMFYPNPITSPFISIFSFYINYYYLCKKFLRSCKDLFDKLFYQFEKIWSKIFKCNYFAQSLTGDIDLNFDYERFKTHFNYFMEKLIINQIPHHGSHKNWKKEFQIDFKVPIHIASVGKFNRYGHPSKKVFENIIENNGVPFTVNEDIWFAIKAEVKWLRGRI